MLDPGRISVAITAAPSAEDVAILYRALRAETARVAGPTEVQTIGILLRGADGVTVGGLWATCLYGWLSINLLYVPETLRQQGYGARLVGMAEEAARTRSCIGVQVSAYEFQAAGFYRRLGFVPFGTQADNPPGHSCTYFAKRLPVSSPYDQLAMQDPDDRRPRSSGIGR